MKLKMIMTAAMTLVTIPSFVWASPAAAPVRLCRSVFTGLTAYEMDSQLRSTSYDLEAQKDLAVTFSYGSEKPILRSFEKEGLFYEEIAEWFPKVKPEVMAKLDARYHKEQSSAQLIKLFSHWLDAVDLSPTAPVWMRAHWDSVKSREKRWNMLAQLPNLFASITIESRAKLFEYRILTFDDLMKSPNSPQGVIVGDDLGSYEVRLDRAIPNRQEFRKLRAATEEFLEGKVGHQHIFHSWPENPLVRADMAPRYIELLDASTWFLYWRQINRNPEVAESILAHPFLGIYSTATLKSLYRSVLEGKPNSFRSKFNMIGARAFRPLEGSEDPAYAIDWELRSGNKGEKREFVENMIEARLVSGDYRGLRDFRQNGDFDTTVNIETAASRFLSDAEVKILNRFEREMPEMRDAHYEVANNHYRKRILAPLMHWEQRLNLAYKADVVLEAQQTYAKKLVKAAQRFLTRKQFAAGNKETIKEAREDAISDLELANYEFADKTRLDQDFERYLLITPTELPSPLVASSGSINVNQIGLGIEYSVRFPQELRPESQSQAQKMIYRLASQVANKFSAKQEPTVLNVDAHGHGVAVKYKIKDQNDDSWRVEWDGIARQYQDGQIVNAWGGHTEIVSPKFAPQTLEGSPVQEIYRTARENGMFPNRAAGGAHVNFDLEFLQQLPPQVATNAVINLIQYFESNQGLIMSLWSHPNRIHAAYPVQIKPELVQALANFHGDLKDLGRTLYTYKYFNTFVGRKPKYVPLNLTALMTDIVPDDYLNRSLDIKNPKKGWFPNFANVTGRGEARLFDAPTDEAMAALQIKYWRAVMNKTFNEPGRIPLVRKYTDQQIQQMKHDPELWKKMMTAHLQDLGLEPQEFSRLMWEAYAIQSTEEPTQKETVEYTDFLPAKR